MNIGAQILESWAKATLEPDINTYYIENIPMWLNSDIKIDGQLILSTRILDQEIQTLKQIFNQHTQTYYTYVELTQKFGTLSFDFLTYNALINVIPRSWKKVLSDLANEELDLVNESRVQKTLMLRNSVSKHFYWNLLELAHNDDNSSSRYRWETELGIVIIPTMWEALYYLGMSTTVSTKLRYFHYRVLNKILVTNVTRAKWDKDISSKCHYCNQANETILHLLCTCKIISKIWTNLSKWLRYFYNLEIDFTNDIIILNNYSGVHKQMINMYILSTKQLIYAKRCLNEGLIFPEVIERFNYWYNIEKTAIKDEAKYKKFKAKWHLHEQTM